MTSSLGDVKKLVKSVTPMKTFGTVDDIAWALFILLLMSQNSLAVKQFHQMVDLCQNQ